VKILVTGATGFIGSHLVRALSDRGYDVYGLVRHVAGRPPPSDFNPIFGDVRNYHDVCSAVIDVKPHVVVHLASLTAVSQSFDHPFDFAETNLIGTMNVAHAVLRHRPDIDRMLHASTPEVYGWPQEIPISEKAPLRPVSPYAVSKASADTYLLYLFKAYRFPVVLLRNANTYGRKKSRHFVVEAIVTKMLTNPDKIWLGSPEPRRDFEYIDDHVSSYLTCLEADLDVVKGQVFNFSSGDNVSIRELADRIARIIGWQGSIRWNALPRRPYDQPIVQLDWTKARRLLGWTPKVRLDEGLRRTVNYWKKICV